MELLVSVRSTAEMEAALAGGADIIDSLPLPARQSPTYLKLGFAGMPNQRKIQRLIGTAVSAAVGRSPLFLTVAVAYADATRAGTAPPEAIRRAAARTGARGILVDTHTKDGLGVRGAVCEGGRNGPVDSTRVRAFREKLASTSGSVQGASLL